LASYAAALSLWVYWPALGRYFSPDDLILLERWRGLTPPIRSLWRFLSGRAYFDLAVPLFQMNPVPYLAVNVVLHCLNVVLVHMLARRLSGNAITAGLAAVLFGSSRLFFSLVGQVVGFGDLLSLGAMLTACIVLTSESSQRAWIAVPIALLAVLAKESVVLLPLSLVCFGERIRRRSSSSS
jgi:hypothetical protein